MDCRHAVQISHLLELRRRAIGELPAAGRGVLFHQFRLAQAVAAPDAQRHPTAPRLFDAVIAGEDVPKDAFHLLRPQFRPQGVALALHRRPSPENVWYTNAKRHEHLAIMVLFGLEYAIQDVRQRIRGGYRDP